MREKSRGRTPIGTCHFEDVDVISFLDKMRGIAKEEVILPRTSSAYTDFSQEMEKSRTIKAKASTGGAYDVDYQTVPCSGLEVSPTKFPWASQ